MPKDRKRGPGRAGKRGVSHPTGKSSKFREYAAGRAPLEQEGDSDIPELSEDSSQPSFLAALDNLVAESSKEPAEGVLVQRDSAIREGEEGNHGRDEGSEVIVPGVPEPEGERHSLTSGVLRGPPVRREGFDESSESDDTTGAGKRRPVKESGDSGNESPSGISDQARRPGPAQRLSLDEFISRATKPMEDRHVAATLDLEAQAVDDHLGGVQTRVLGEKEKLDQEKKAVRRQVFAEAARWTDLVDLQSRPDVVMAFGQPRTHPRLPERPGRPTEMDAILEAAQIAPPAGGSTTLGSDLPGLQGLGVSDRRKQSFEIARLRAILAANEQKLRRWAKIKSRSFRKIHNREKRVQRRERDLQHIREEQERIDRGQIWGDNQYDGWASADAAGALREPAASDRTSREDQEVFRLAQLARELGESNPYTDFANQFLDLQYKRGTMSGGEFAARSAEGDAEEREAELAAQHIAETAAREGIDLEADPEATLEGDLGASGTVSPTASGTASGTDIRSNYLRRRIREQKRLMAALQDGEKGEEGQPQSGRMILGDLGPAVDTSRPFEDSDDEEFVPRRVKLAGEHGVGVSDVSGTQRRISSGAGPRTSLSGGSAGKPPSNDIDDSRSPEKVLELYDDVPTPAVVNAPESGRNSLQAKTGAELPGTAAGTSPGPLQPPRSLGPPGPNVSELMQPARGRVPLSKHTGSAIAEQENPFLRGEVQEAENEGRSATPAISVKELVASLETTGDVHPTGVTGPSASETGRHSDVLEAFGDGLPENDFQFQKQALAREQLEEPMLDDQRLPGWGSWVGAGISAKKRKELSFQHAARRAAAKAELDRQMQARKDASLSWVAMAEAGEKEAVANYAARGLYRTSEGEYAEYLSTAVSPEWQSVSAFRASIQPKREVEKSRVISPAQVDSSYVNHMQGERQIDKLKRRLSEQERKMHKTTSARQVRKVKF